MDGIPICIKFVTRHCAAAYEFLAAEGFAPKLHSVERLPGGLYMVVMDDVSTEYVNLFNLIQGNRGATLVVICFQIISGNGPCSWGHTQYGYNG